MDYPARWGAESPPWKIIKEFLVIFLLASGLLLAVGLAHYLADARATRITREAAERLNVAVAETSIGHDIGNVVSDLLYLAKHNERQGLFAADDPDKRDRLARDFLVFSQQKRLYDQIRYLDETGQEIVRINYDDGTPLPVPGSELQDKAERYYFAATLALEPGEVYLSPLDLNIEQGRIEQPPKPMLRFGTPVLDAAGRNKGVLLLNYLGARLLLNFRRVTANIADHIMLLNAEGFWLSSPRPEDEWGFMYGHEQSFGKRYPAAWSRVQALDSGQIRGPEGLFTFTTVYPLRFASADETAQTSKNPERKAAEYYWKIVSHLPLQGLAAAPWFRQQLPLYTAMLGLLAVGSAVLARARVKHHQALAQVEFEQRFRETLENVDLLAVGLDARGNITFCNDALLHVTDWPRENVLGHNWFEQFIPASERKENERRFAGMLSRRPTAPQHESEIETRYGERRLVSWNDSPMFGPERRVIGMTCIGEDITETRRAEEELRKLSQAVEQSPSIVMIVDVEGKIEYVNPKFTQLTGYTAEEVCGRNPRFLKSGKTGGAEYRQLWATIVAGGEWRGVFQNRKKNGKLYWEAASISPIRNTDGRITYYLAVKEDITDRVQLEKKLRLFFESAPSAMAMVNQTGEIVLANSEMATLFGYEREELIGKPVEMLLPARARTHHGRYRDDFFATPQARRMGGGRDLLGKRKNGGTFPLEIGLSPIETEEGTLVLCAIVDITERQRLEQAVETRNREIAKNQALAAMGRMASMIAHDLRNPLSSIKMGLQILGKKTVRDWQDDEHEIHQIALEQVDYMEGILEALLSYSRPEALNPEWLSVEKLLETAVLLAQRHIEEHRVKVKTWYQPGLPTLHADAHKLRQVFSNLIVNAVQSTESVTDRQAEISLSTHLELGVDRPVIRVDIVDNGAGIKPDQEDRLFEPFFTTRSKGTGLGLAIVKRIVDQHHGRVRLKPADTGGTCASVLLPTGPVENDPDKRPRHGDLQPHPQPAAEQVISGSEKRGIQ